MLSLWLKWSTKEGECDEPLLPALQYGFPSLWSPLLWRIWTRQCCKTFTLQLYTYWSTWLERLNWIFLAHYPFALHTTLCVRSTLFQLYLKTCPFHKQTNKWVCSSSVWWCWFEMIWNFGKLKESAHWWRTLPSPDSALWIFLSQNLREVWNSYFRLKSIKSGFVGECLRMGVFVYVYGTRRTFRSSRYVPRRLPFPSF